MIKKEKLNGRDVLFFIDGLPFALSTSCSLEVTTNTTDTRTKDSAPGPDKEVDFIDWKMNVESLIGASADNSGAGGLDAQMLYDDLLAKQLAGERVTVVIGSISRANAPAFDPEAIWTPEESVNLGSFSGEAIIASTSGNFPVEGKATCSASFEGAGALTRTPRTGAATTTDNTNI